MPWVLGRPLEHFAQVLDFGVDGAGDERGLAADGDRERVERVVDRAHRRALGLFAERRRGRVLALREAVDAVVEQDDVDVDVAADGVHQVVAADREAVAVARDDPDVQIGPHRLQARGHGRRAAVDGVHAVRVHVVREPAGAADAGDEHDLLAGMPRAGITFFIWARIE